MFVCYCVPKKTGVYQRGGQAVEYVVSNIILVQKTFGLSIFATHHKRLCGRI